MADEVAFGGRWSRLEAFGGLRGLSFANFWWLTWIAVHTSLVEDEVVYKPLVAYLDYRV